MHGRAPRRRTVRQPRPTARARRAHRGATAVEMPTSGRNFSRRLSYTITNQTGQAREFLSALFSDRGQRLTRRVPRAAFRWPCQRWSGLEPGALMLPWLGWLWLCCAARPPACMRLPPACLPACVRLLRQGRRAVRPPLFKRCCESVAMSAGLLAARVYY